MSEVSHQELRTWDPLDIEVWVEIMSRKERLEMIRAVLIEEVPNIKYEDLVEVFMDGYYGIKRRTDDELFEELMAIFGIEINDDPIIT